MILQKRVLVLAMEMAGIIGMAFGQQSPKPSRAKVLFPFVTNVNGFDTGRAISLDSPAVYYPVRRMNRSEAVSFNLKVEHR
jgi:hypothetical protein